MAKLFFAKGQPLLQLWDSRAKPTLAPTWNGCAVLTFPDSWIRRPPRGKL